MSDVVKAPMVNTVAGEISIEALGFTLPHEHLFNDIGVRELYPNPDYPAIFDVPVTPENAWILRENPLASLDNCRLDSVTDALDELTEYKKYGGQTVIDVTPEGQGRNLTKLQEVSKKTGINIIAGGGWYLEPYHPQWMDGMGPDSLAEYMLREDYGPTAKRHKSATPGVIGEIGISPGVTSNEIRSLRAACRVQREANLPLFVHLPGFIRAAHRILDIILVEENVPNSAVVLCHIDPSGSDGEYQLSIADRGVWLEFDMIGMPFRFNLPGEGRAPDLRMTAEAIERLVNRGYGSSLLFSHDMFLKTMLRRNGGNGLSFIPSLFDDVLRFHTNCDINTQKVNVNNVKKLFSLSLK